MSPSAISPTDNMSQQQASRTSSSDSAADAIRKRVCKACDRCRMKKSKCDGSSPCSRCKADNAICVFGERKKSHDKVYPKGYVEMLEQQQSQLVAGLQEMYRRALGGQAWNGPQLSEASGHPLTHDILAALNLLEPKGDSTGEMESFEEDCQKLQSRLVASGAPYVQRRGSFSSDSDHSQHSHSRTASHSTPVLTKAASLREYHNHQVHHHSNNLNFTPSPSPLSQSPIPQAQKLFGQPTPINTSRTTSQASSFGMTSASPLSMPSSCSTNSHFALGGNDPQFYQPAWARPDVSAPAAFIRSKYAMQAAGGLDDSSSSSSSSNNNNNSNLHNNVNDLLMPTDDVVIDEDFLDAAGWDDAPMDFAAFGNAAGFGQTPYGGARDFMVGGGGALDPMELDLSRHVSVVT